MASTAPPWGSLLTGPVPSGAGLQRAFMIARVAADYEIVVAGCETACALERIGIEATDAPAEAVAGAGALEIARPFARLPQLARPPG